MLSRPKSVALASALALLLTAMPVTSAHCTELTASAESAVTAEADVDPHPASLVSVSVDKSVAGVGDTVNISYKVEDPEGVEYVSPSFVVGDFSGDGTSSTFGTSTTSTYGGEADPDRSSGILPIRVTSDMREGTWHLVRLRVLDRAGYTTTFVDSAFADIFGTEEGEVVADLSAVTFEVVQSDDPHPASLASLSVDKLVAGVGDTVSIAYRVEDAEGVESVSPSLVVGDFSSDGTMGMSSMSSTTREAEPDRTSGTIQIRVTSDTGEGTWHLVRLRVMDEAGYVTTIVDRTFAAAYGSEEGEVVADLSAAAFEVVQSDDPHSASLTSLTVDKPVAGVGDTVNVSYRIRDAEGVESISSQYTVGESHNTSVTGGVTTSVPGGSPDESYGSTTFRVTSDYREGSWHLVCLTVMDKAGYVTRFVDESSAAAYSGRKGVVVADLSAATFVVDHAKEPDPAPTPEYHAVEGAGTTYDLTSDEPLRIVFDGPFDKFTGLEIDGAEVPRKSYEVSAGSTVVSIDGDYLAALPAGQHVATASYANGGTASATFTTVAARGSEKTPEGNGPSGGNESSDGTNKGDGKSAGNTAGTSTKSGSSSTGSGGTTTSSGGATSGNGSTTSGSGSSTGTKTASSSSTTPKTGDASVPALAGVAIAGFGAFLVGLGRVGRRSR